MGLVFILPQTKILGSEICGKFVGVCGKDSQKKINPITSDLVMGLRKFF